MKILIIDDWRGPGSIGTCFPDASVAHEYQIPADLSKLDDYDILIVDNQGIGNAKWRSGEEFLKDYQPKNPNQMVIFHSGFGAEKEFAELLKRKGFFSFTKGDNPEDLVALVKEHFKMSKTVKSKKRYTDSYMVYGCDDCCQGFKMYLEDTLETHDPEKHKPVPFSIQCPFCKGHSCFDVSGKIKIPRQKLTKHMPSFWNVEGDDCGKPMNMDQAKPEFRKNTGEEKPDATANN